MAKSEDTSEFRLIHIEGRLIRDHHHLIDGDECYCFGEYQSGMRFDFSPTNQLISNYKKPVDRKNRPEYKYKEQAIKDVSNFVISILKQNAIDNCTFIPVPPSKVKTDPLYDDRLGQSLRNIRPVLDVRDLIIMKESMEALHTRSHGEKRMTPDEMYSMLDVDKSCLSSPLRQQIILFDDMITTGTHFKACQRLLKEVAPDCAVLGLFIARRKLPNPLDSLCVIDD